MNLRYFLPHLEANDLRYSRLLQSVFIRKALLAYGFFAVASADFFNLLSVHFRHAVRFTLGVAALGDHVIVIIGIGSEKQMIGSYARRIITAMENMLIVWNRAIMDFPRRSMSTDAAILWIFPDLPVAILIGSSGPRPTLIGDYDACPKPFQKRRLTSRRAKHTSLLILSFRPRVKECAASIARLCYFESRQCVDLLIRFMRWLGPSVVPKTAAGCLYCSTLTLSPRQGLFALPCRKQAGSL